MSTIDWQALAIANTHPLQLELLQDLLDADEPLSPKGLSDLHAIRHGADSASLQLIAYHIRCLVDKGLLELASTRPRRGALEHFYAATDKARAGERELAAVTG